MIRKQCFELDNHLPTFEDNKVEVKETALKKIIEFWIDSIYEQYNYIVLI